MSKQLKAHSVACPANSENHAIITALSAILSCAAESQSPASPLACMLHLALHSPDPECSAVYSTLQDMDLSMYFLDNRGKKCRLSPQIFARSLFRAFPLISTGGEIHDHVNRVKISPGAREAYMTFEELSQEAAWEAAEDARKSTMLQGIMTCPRSTLKSPCP